MSDKMNQNQTIESKIKEFQEGIDYKFTGEKHHHPEYAEIANYTIRQYDILSLDLAQNLRKILEAQAAKLMSFDFKGEEAGVRETFEVNDPSSYYCQVDDEFDNMIIYRAKGYGKNQSYPFGYLHIYYIDKPEEKQKFAKEYQKFIHNHKKKLAQNGNQQLTNIPPHGTKCEDCEEEISEYDISQGNYHVENMRISGSVYKVFTHAKKNACGKKRNGLRKLENYVYYPNLASEWQAKQPSEGLCRDLLQKFYDKASNNLIYLESCQKAPWNEVRETDIAATKKMMGEIEVRLQKVKADGRWDDCDNNCADCGVKICCHEKGQGCPDKQSESYLLKKLNHDNHKENDEKDSKNKNNKNLRASSAENNNKVFSVNFLNEVLQWMKQEKITEISLDPVNNKLILGYENGIKQYLTDNDLSPLSQEIKKYFEKNPVVPASFSYQDLEQQYNQLRETSGQESKFDKWILPLSIIGIGVMILVLIRFVKSKKNRIKNNR